MPRLTMADIGLFVVAFFLPPLAVCKSGPPPVWHFAALPCLVSRLLGKVAPSMQAYAPTSL